MKRKRATRKPARPTREAQANLGATTTLPQFLATTGTLTPAQRTKLVDQAEADARDALRASPAQAIDARHRSAAAPQAAALPAGRAVRAAVSRRDDRHLHDASRPAHELHPAQPLRQQDRLPAVPDRRVLRGQYAPLPRLEDAGRLHAPDIQTWRDRHQLERRADRSRGRTECRAAGRQQPGCTARPRTRVADRSHHGDVIAAR